MTASKFTEAQKAFILKRQSRWHLGYCLTRICLAPESEAPHADRPHPHPSRLDLERLLVRRGVQPSVGHRADHLSAVHQASRLASLAALSLAS